MSFVQRDYIMLLKARPDDALTSGGLSRAEVQKGIEHIRAFKV